MTDIAGRLQVLLAQEALNARKIEAEIEALQAEKAAWQGIQEGTAAVVKQLEDENARIKESNLELQAKVEGIYNYLVEEKHENKRLREAGKEVVDWWLRDGVNKFDGDQRPMFNLRAAMGESDDT